MMIKSFKKFQSKTKLKIKNDYNFEKGLYVCAEPLKNTNFNNFVKHLEKTSPVKLNEVIEEPHVTILYSREDKPSDKDFMDKIKFPKTVSAKSSEFVFWDGHDKDGYVVLKLVSKDLSDINKEFVKFAKHSFAEYVPHMTIIKNCAEYKEELLKWIEEINKEISKNPVEFDFDTIKLNDIDENR